MSKNDKNNPIAPTRVIRAGKTKKITSEDGEIIESSIAKGGTRPIPNFGTQGSNVISGNGNQGGSKNSSPKTKYIPRNVEEGKPEKGNLDENPVTGWLVIIEGPGRGASLKVGYGMHKIGRGDDQDICVNFGDDKISRNRHASIEYDPKTHEFYVSKGDNLVYLNGKRVGSNSESEILTGDELELGESKFKFVSFCGPNFDWSDNK